MKRKVKQIAGKILLVLGCVLIFGQLEAQPADHRPFRMLPDSAQVDQLIEDLSMQLKLSPEQKDEIAELHHAHFNEARLMMKQMEIQRDSHKEKMDVLKYKFEAEFVAKLTDVQKLQFEQIKKEHEKKKGHVRPRKM